jgi:hypothetical protein
MVSARQAFMTQKRESFLAMNARVHARPHEPLMSRGACTWLHSEPACPRAGSTAHPTTIEVIFHLKNRCVDTHQRCEQCQVPSMASGMVNKQTVVCCVRCDEARRRLSKEQGNGHRCRVDRREEGCGHNEFHCTSSYVCRRRPTHTQKGDVDRVKETACA